MNKIVFDYCPYEKQTRSLEIPYTQFRVIEGNLVDRIGFNNCEHFISKRCNYKDNCPLYQKASM